MGLFGGYILSEMYQIIPSYFEHNDERGTVRGLLNSGVWKEINFISTEANCERGRHYHKETIECFIMLSGSVRVTFHRPKFDNGWQVEERVFTEGDVFKIFPGVEHRFVTEDKCEWINLLSIPFDKSNPDFHTYSEA